FRQFLLAYRFVVYFSPFVLRLVVNVKITIARRHRIGGNFCATNSREDVCDLRDTPGNFLLGPALLFDALLDVDAAGPKNHHRESAFIELWNEIRTEIAEDENRQCE